MEGIEQLMKSNLMPMLIKILLNGNNDPNLFNSIMNSKNANRIQVLSAYNNYLTSIDPNINPKHTRRLLNLILSSSAFIDSDFEAL